MLKVNNSIVMDHSLKDRDTGSDKCIRGDSAVHKHHRECSHRPRGTAYHTPRSDSPVRLRCNSVRQVGALNTADNYNTTLSIWTSEHRKGTVKIHYERFLKWYTCPGHLPRVKLTGLEAALGLTGLEGLGHCCPQL